MTVGTNTQPATTGNYGTSSTGETGLGFFDGAQTINSSTRPGLNYYRMSNGPNAGQWIRDDNQYRLRVGNNFNF